MIFLKKNDLKFTSNKYRVIIIYADIWVIYLQRHWQYKCRYTCKVCYCCESQAVRFRLLSYVICSCNDLKSTSSNVQNSVKVLITLF